MLVAHAGIGFVMLASCGPTVAALVTSRLANGGYRAFRLNVSWVRTLGAGVLGVVLIVAAYAVLPASAVVDPWKLHWSALLSTRVYDVSTLLGGPLFEEPGWRGFALPRLESRLSPISASLVLSVLWMGWHLPLFLYPGWATSSVWMFLLWTSGISVLMTLGANLARFGVIVPIAMHAMVNTTHQFFEGLFTNTQPGSGGFLFRLLPKIPVRGHLHLHINFELVIALSGWTVALLVMILTKGRLAYDARAGAPKPSMTKSRQA